MVGAVPVILLAFANDREERGSYLRGLIEERRALDSVFKSGHEAGRWETKVLHDVMADELFGLFQDRHYRGRITVLHYGGHADSFGLLLDSSNGRPEVAGAAGLAAFLAQQDGLQLVVLNGCSTAGQVQGLLDAGVPAVIATAREIDDAVATQFARRFHSGLAGGATLESAFAEASAALQSNLADARTALRDIRRDQPRVAHDHANGSWPWALYVNERAPNHRTWRLPIASAADPLAGAPPLPRMLRLPPATETSPYRHLRWYAREHAGLFFGRAQSIRRVLDVLVSADEPPILLLYAQSGTGKSSLLAAGVLPRLEATHEIRYVRRETQRPLHATLAATLEEIARANPVMPDDASPSPWHAAEARAGKPVLIVLDQVEEALLQQATANAPDELRALADDLVTIFDGPAGKPGGKLVLSFRKEWLPEVANVLTNAMLVYAQEFLQRIDRDGIIEAITAPARDPLLKQRFGLTVADGLAERIAEHLLADAESPVAPTLQVLLATMWERAYQANPGKPAFTEHMFDAMRAEGVALLDYVDQALAAIEVAHPEKSRSGLVLELLATFVTRHGTAGALRATEIDALFAHVAPEVSVVMHAARAQYLLVDSADEVADRTDAVTRLAHDALAPIVRARYDESDRPGQRARRILEERMRGARGGASPRVLDEVELASVEAGREGMRAWTAAEAALVQATRAAFEEQQRMHGVVRAITREADPVHQLLALAELGDEEPPGALQLVAALSGTHVPGAVIEVRSRLACVWAGEHYFATGTRDGACRLWGYNRYDGSVEVAADWYRQGAVVGARTISGMDIYGIVACVYEDDVLCVYYNALQTPEVFRRSDVRRAEFASTSIETDVTGDQIFRLLIVLTTGDVEVLDITISAYEDEALLPEPHVSVAERLAIHEAGVSCAEIDRDGGRLVTGWADGAVRVHTLSDESESVLLTGHTDAVTTLCFTEDRTLLSGSADCTARVWQLDGAGAVVTLEGHTQSVTAVGGNGQFVWTASRDGTVRQWYLDWEARSGSAWGDQWSIPPRARVVPAGFTGVAVLDTDGKFGILGTASELAPTSWSGAGISDVFSREGTCWTVGDDGFVRSWDEHGELHTVISHRSSIADIAFEPGDERVAVGAGNKFFRYLADAADNRGSVTHTQGRSRR